MTNETVDVRDRKNPERLLGRLMQRPCSLQGNAVELAVRNRGPLHSFDPADYINFGAPDPVTRVRFEVSFRPSEGGYVKHAEFLTDAPLGVLMMLDTFCLPGETFREANYRRCNRP